MPNSSHCRSDRFSGGPAAVAAVGPAVRAKAIIKIDNGAPAAKDKDEPRTDEFSLPIDDTKAPKIIDSVIKHLKPELPADEWKDIIINLQALLDDPSNKLVEWTDPLSKDRKPKKESIKIVVNKLIGRFSKQGRDFYQREVGPTADQKLKEAMERGDVRQISDVSLRYFHTKAGAEATLWMGRNHLDRGRYNAAAETFRRFMERNQEDQIPANLNFMAALAWKRLAIGAAARNDKDGKELYQKLRRASYWDKVKKEVGGKKIAEFGSREVTLVQLEAEYSRPIAVKENRAQSDWHRERGNPQNNGQGVGSRPFLDPTWQFSMMPILDKEDQEKKGSGMAWIEQNLKQFMQMIDQRPNHPPIPAFFPIASSGKIVFRTYDGVYCLATRDDPNQKPPIKAGDFSPTSETSGLLWMVECDNSLYSMVSTGGRRNQIEQWNSFYTGPQGPYGIFFENGLIGSLSHDGTLVYFVDDIAVPPHPQMQMNFGNNGTATSYGKDFDEMVRCNKLVAVNLETGKIVWKAGGRQPNKMTKAGLLDGTCRSTGEEEKETALSLLSDAYFLGAPLPLAGKLYVVIEKDRELRLVCLDPTKVANRFPELVWSQPLGTPSVPLPADTLRRIQGISLAYSERSAGRADQRRGRAGHRFAVAQHRLGRARIARPRTARGERRIQNQMMFSRGGGRLSAGQSDPARSTPTAGGPPRRSFQATRWSLPPTTPIR